MKNPFNEELISIHIISFLNAKDALQLALCNQQNLKMFQIAIRENIISNQILTKAIYRNRFQPRTYCKIVHYSNSRKTLSFKLLPFAIHHGSSYPILNHKELYFTPQVFYHPFVLSVYTSYSTFHINWQKMSNEDLQYRLHITPLYITLYFIYHFSKIIFYTLQFIGILGIVILFIILSFQPFIKDPIPEPIFFHFHQNLSYIDHACSQRLLEPSPLGNVQEQYCSLPFPYVI